LKSVEEKHRKDLKQDLKEKIDAIEKQLQSLLTELKDKAKHLSQVIEETKKLEKAINDYFGELKKINFPERLDKIDNQISSINIGVGNLQTAIQNTQTKIDTVNLAVNETKKSIESKQNENHKTLTQRLDQQDKELRLLKTVLFVACGLILIGIIATIFIK
jgi:chromosome segregation ATPase